MKKQALKLSELRVHSFITSLSAEKSMTILGAGTQLIPCGVNDGTINPCHTMPLGQCSLPGSLELNGCKIQSIQQACPD